MTREEAIKEAYGIPVTKAQHEALQFLIPELRDSEDERIRKKLLEYFTARKSEEGDIDEEWYGLSYEEIIAYLEKQKEQKPADDKDFEDNSVYVRMIADSKTGEKYPFISYKDQLQKSAEWSEGDEKMREECINAIRYARCEQGEDDDLEHEPCILWLKSLRHQPHWKPSEEQMKVLQYVCEESSHPNQDVIPTLQSLYNDLKSL